MTNVLLVVVDCLRADAVYDHMAIIPTMKKLRQSGFSFLNAITSSTTTTPSFASLFTGLYPFEHGVRSLSGYRLSNKTVTFPEIMREAGYHTYAEVTGPMVEEAGFAERFDEYHCREPHRTIHTDWGHHFIEKVRDHYKEPWLVLLHVWSLHQPRIVSSKCESRRFGHSLYARAVSSVDHYLGRLAQHIGENTLTVVTGDHGEQIARSPIDSLIKKLGRKAYKKLRYHSLIDLHFSKGMRHFHVGHGHGVYDSLVRIPLIFHNEKLIPPGQSPCQVRHFDLFPTIMDLIGIGHPKITGRSLVPIMMERVEANRDVYLEAAGTVIPTKDEWLEGIRVDNTYKYIHSPFRADFKEELYLLRNDPKEKHNVANRHPNVVAGLRKKIASIKTTSATGEKVDEEDQELLLNRLRALGYIDGP